MDNPLSRYKAEAGLTQGALAERLSMPQSQVSRLMSGKRLPSLETILRIERATGVRASEWTEWLARDAEAAQ